jgi:hypothetical protein
LFGALAGVVTGQEEYDLATEAVAKNNKREREKRERERRRIEAMVKNGEKKLVQAQVGQG